MDEFHRLARELKIEVVQEEVKNLRDIKESVVFNCSGLGAKELNNDSQMVPVQGHILMLKNQVERPKRNYMVLATVGSGMIYVTPKGEGAIGSSFIKGESSLLANPHQFDAVLARAQDFFAATNPLPPAKN